MRDLNLGPDTRKLIERWHGIEWPPTVNNDDALRTAGEMAKMLERWIEVAWCGPDACPATVCGGPHVKVRYDFDNTVDVIEPIHKIGTTFAEAPYHVITD
jgi:hypothetical protein